WLEQMNPKGYALVDCQFYSYGCINSKYHSLFLSGALVMCEGKTIDSSVKNGIVISKDIADKHGLKVGDTIQAVNTPLTDDETRDLEIVGLFEAVVDNTDERNNYNESSYYEYTNNAFVSEAAMKNLLENYADVGYSAADFFVNDPERLESILREVQNIKTINWNNFLITVNDEVYQNISSALSDTGTLITTLIYVITAVSMALMILILSMSVRSRKREIGILLAVGIAKPAIVLQYVLETLLIAAAAFPLAYLSSRQAAGALGTLFDKASEYIIVTPGHFVLVTGVGSILLVAAVLVSCIPAMRLKPKTILSQMD
ncbi:MAG: FtsX-like permease family protein, partial [Oscillospiraceae bacterium]|nr:FtsX-like permease family protein [Oscillospiraceae bacterium]